MPHSSSTHALCVNHILLWPQCIWKKITHECGQMILLPCLVFLLIFMITFTFEVAWGNHAKVCGDWLCLRAVVSVHCTWHLENECDWMRPVFTVPCVALIMQEMENKHEKNMYMFKKKNAFCILKIVYYVLRLKFLCNTSPGKQVSLKNFWYWPTFKEYFH